VRYDIDMGDFRLNSSALRALAAALALAVLTGCGRPPPPRPNAAAPGDQKEKGMLKDADRKAVAKRFEEIKEAVKIVMFTQETECEYCSATRELALELAKLSDKLSVEVLDFVEDKARADELKVDKIPALAIMGEKDYGIRFFGVPAGYEFSTLIEDIVMVGKREHGLPEDVVKELAKVDSPVHMQVVVSPTCPYCPRAVLVAHRFAMASDMIRGDMVEGSEFPHLVVKYGVQGVPHTVINEEHSFVGALPEADAAKAVLKAVGK
jgi:glutaredoxin-like protein